MNMFKPLTSLLLALFLFACSHDVKILDSADIEGRNADNLLIVDCLLPSSVRRLGTAVTYLGPRRVVKTSAIDCQIRGGEYVAADRANYQTALKVWLPLAQSGDAKAQTYVGEIYEKGLGTKPDYVKAKSWYEKAVQKGDSRAQMNLGFLYESGQGVTRDVAKAMNLYREASGLKKGQLEYVSSVQIAQRSTQLQQNQQLTREVTLARNALQQSRREISLLQKEVATLNTLLTTNTQINAQQRQLIKESINRKEVALEKQKSTSKKVSDKLKETNSTHREVSSREVAKIESANAPVIEITSPPISALRSGGKPTVTLASQARNTVIKGNVSPFKNVKVMVNGKTAIIDNGGSFSHKVPVKESGSEVTIVALNDKGKQTDFGFVLVPGNKNAALNIKAPSASAQVPSLKNVSFGKYYALVIGNNDYENLPKLKTSVNDARAVANLLASKYGFRSIVVKNASRGKTLAVLNSLRKKLTASDNLIIYYAGHGQIDASNNGFWQPVDALKDNQASWISNKQISEYLDAIPAKHILVVADSCYSGTLSRTSIPRPPVSVPQRKLAWYKTILSSKVRVVLSSGGVKPVLDTGGSNNHSIFASAFLDALNKNNSLMEASSLYQKVKLSVSKRAKQKGVEQIPLFSPVRYAGHQTGDFFLVDKKKLLARTDNEKQKPHQPDRWYEEQALIVLKENFSLDIQA